MSKPLTDQKLFQRLADGKAVKDRDGDLYWIGSDGMLVYASGQYVEPNEMAFGNTHTKARTGRSDGEPEQAFYAARKPRSAK